MGELMSRVRALQVLHKGEVHPFFAPAARVLQCEAMAQLWHAVLVRAVGDVDGGVGMGDAIIDATVQLMSYAVQFAAATADGAAAAGGGTPRPEVYAMLEAPRADGASLLQLLQQLRDERLKGNVNPATQEGVAWLLRTVCAADEACNRQLGGGAARPGVDAAAASDALERQRSKAEAQKRAMADMQRMQMSFLEGMSCTSSEDEDEDGADLAQSMAVEPGGGGDGAGDSGVGAAAAPVVGGGPASQDRVAVASSTQEEEEDDDLASLPQCALCHEPSQLAPAKRIVAFLAFAQSFVRRPEPGRGKGAAGLAVSLQFFQHAVHLDTYDNYYVSLMAKKAAGERYEGMFSTDLDSGEFLSPVCKSICNLLVPAVIDGAAAIRRMAADALITEPLPPGYSCLDVVASFTPSATHTGDTGVATLEHVVRMLGALYGIADRPPAMMCAATWVECAAVSITATIDIAANCYARKRRLGVGVGGGLSVWHPLQLRQLQNMFDATRFFVGAVQDEGGGARANLSEEELEWIGAHRTNFAMGARLGALLEPLAAHTEAQAAARAQQVPSQRVLARQTQRNTHTHIHREREREALTRLGLTRWVMCVFLCAGGVSADALRAMGVAGGGQRLSRAVRRRRRRCHRRRRRWRWWRCRHGRRRRRR